MTPERLGSLTRIKHNHSHLRYVDAESGYYSTNDITVLLDLLEEQEQKLLCIEEDLEELQTHLNSCESDYIVKTMVESTLTFLSYEE